METKIEIIQMLWAFQDHPSDEEAERIANDIIGDTK